jgi:hypothetical protein
MLCKRTAGMGQEGFFIPPVQQKNFDKKSFGRSVNNRIFE